MPSVPTDLSQKVRNRILEDMRPTPVTIGIKSGAALTLGVILSLFTCGQLGLGIGHAQMHFDNLSHGHYRNAGAALVCGIIFALISPVILRFICSGLQFRIIIRKTKLIALIWLLGLGCTLAHYGVLETRISSFTLWCVVVWVTMESLSRLIDWVGIKKIHYPFPLGISHGI